MLLARHCEYCGKPMANYTSTQKYHTDCSYKAAKARRSKPVKQCAECGCSLEGYDYRCRYCSACAKKRHDATKNKTGHSKPRSKPKPKPNEAPIVSANEITRRANALGLSYGQYSAQYGLYDKIYKGGLHI